MKKLLICFIVLVGVFAFGQNASAQTATLSFSPSSQTLQTGALFTVTVMVNTGGQQVNAVAAYFTYPADKLEALQVNTSGSVMKFSAEATAGGGQVRISGGSPTPGVVGFQQVGSVQFRVLRPGAATLSFTPDSAALTDVGNQNILNIPASLVATFQIVASPPSSPIPSPTGEPPITPLPSPTDKPVSLLKLAISDVRAEILTQDSVRLSWRTNAEAKGQVYYGPRSQEDYPFFILDGILAAEHSFVLSNIEHPEEYALEIVGIDAFGNQVRTERLLLPELVEKEKQPSGVPGVTNSELTIGMFVLFPVLISLLVAFVFFRRMKARPKR